ncbi:complement C5 isoform X2 [Betta splendens]|uniref:Complement C5 isoform X2 n=1 Tax=Betta splendens TaxID=158456 RepID=A0A9W2XZL1_BETSP|nr:complement C5 isoform X2 [Betta splendens]
MKLCVILLSVCWLCCRTEAEHRSFLITAPLSLRLDAQERVVVQVFGFSEPVTVYVFLKTSMAPNHAVLAREAVTLNSQNKYQADAKVRLRQLDKSLTQVVLHVQSPEINQHVFIPVSRTNGFLFIQTDKPLYTPDQSVKVRAFSLNQELRPADRSVFLTFKDPDETTVDMVEMSDANNGIPSMQNPFKIPVKPKLGIWSIEASYSDDFTTSAKTDFEVKEYVLPSFSILVEPSKSYISYGQFNSFSFKVTARYLYGAPVAGGQLYLRYGYVSGKSAPVIIPDSRTSKMLSDTGEAELVLNMEKVLSKSNGPKDLNSLVGKYLYIAVLLEETQGGVTQEAEFAAVKFVKSPYTLSLVSTPPFIKPKLPYNIQVLVKDHLDQPVNQVRVRLVKQEVFGQAGNGEDMACNHDAVSQSGIAVFICNVPSEAVKAVLQFETAEPSLLAASQATLSLMPVAYHSPNQRYLYIDPPPPGRSLKVGEYSNIKVYSATPSNLNIKALSYLVLSKGNVVHYDSQKFLSTVDNKQTLNFEVTPDMVPSIRVLVYYILYGEGTSELVADSVWLDVSDKCVNGLKMDLSLDPRDHKPKEKLNLNIQTNQEGLVALSAVDSAVLLLRPKYRDPLTRVLRHIEVSDLGCGGGGGKDSADVFRLAGLTFLTNANSQPASGEACTAEYRAPERVKRVPTDQEKRKKVEGYSLNVQKCCKGGMKHVPKVMTCEEFAQQRFKKNQTCKQVFQECCEYIQQSLGTDQTLILAREALGADFDLAPSLVRSYFPESWLWNVQPIRPGQMTVMEELPDSLTTWEIRAIGMSKNGICVAETQKVSVNLPLSMNIPLPYQVVRGEQLELKGSVYNQQTDTIQYCVMLMVGPELCLLHSRPTPEKEGLHSTSCKWEDLSSGGIGVVTFTVLALELGEHNLTFILKTRAGNKDILQKKLRVVPEGVRKEQYAGGTLDPQAVYGTERRKVELMARLPNNIVPKTDIQRVLTINGEVLGDILSVIHSAEGLRQLTNLPTGSAEEELGAVLLLVQVYHYLEATSGWEVLGGDIQSNSADLTRKIKQGLVGISSFRQGSSYSMWSNSESSTWLTALVVKTLALVDGVVSLKHQTLADSVFWLINSAQQVDGSFKEKSLYRPNRIMAEGADPVEQSVYLTSFVLIALNKATSLKDPILQLRSHYDSMNSAANYISQHALNVRSVYVCAVATYALNLHDSSSIVASQLLSKLENLARQKGHPAQLRYWQEAGAAVEWLNPDQSSGVTVETTAYVLLTVLLKGGVPYAKPIVSWLTQDQHYGQGFYSSQDTVLTLEALTEYSKLGSRSALSQDISIRYKKRGLIQQVQLSQKRPVVSPIQVEKTDDITVSTGYGSGVSSVKLRTVYYETTSSTQKCNFDLKIKYENATMRSPRLIACAKYKPPPNEAATDSLLTVMKIQLPTGVEAMVEDLKQFRDIEERIISHFELQGSTVVIQAESVPSSVLMCIGFRVRTGFSVSGTTESVFSVYEPQDKGSMCTKVFTFQVEKLERLCKGEQCQCMTATCAASRGNFDLTLTAAKRTEETCRPHVKYAFRATVVSSAADGEFMTYTATVEEPLKTGKGFEAVTPGTQVDLVKKATCRNVTVQNNQQYLVLGTSGAEIKVGPDFRYRFPLDDDAVVELWPKECSSPECEEYIKQLNDYALELFFNGCPTPL